MQTDVELIERSKKGDQQAFAEIVKRHSGIVKKTTLSMVRRREIADDVAQEVFIRFYNNMDQFKGESALSTYLVRIAINLSLNEREKIKRQQQNFVKYSAEAQHAPTFVRPDKFGMKELINEALDKLEDEFRSVVVLRLIDGYTVQETADILDLPKGTVASRLNRAQKKLLEIFQQMKILDQI